LYIFFRGKNIGNILFVFFGSIVYNQGMNPIITKKRITVLLLVIFCFTLPNIFFKTGLKDFCYSQSERLQASLWNKGSGDAFSRKNQEDLNRKLIEENQKLLSQVADLQNIKQENDSLREALGLNIQKDFDLAIGRVISKEILKDSILINIGTADGVKKGFPVILSGKTLLGRVVDVYPSYSRVLLITNKDNKIDVEIPESGGFALSRGEGGMKVSLDMFPRDKELKEGNLIVTSALGGNYPAGLLMGKVKNVKKLDNEAFQMADIELVFDLSTINNVFVIKNTEIYND